MILPALRVVLVTFTLLAPAAAVAEEKSVEEYWGDTGINSQLALAQGAFSARYCKQDFNQFHGCVQAINAALAGAQPPLQLLPSASLDLFGVARDTIVTEAGNYAIVKQNPPRFTGTLREIYRQTDAYRNRIEAAHRGVYTAARDQGFTGMRDVDFENLFREAIRLLPANANTDASATARAITAYIVHALDAHGRIQPIAQFLEETQNADSSFMGIGVEIRELNGKVVVNRVLEGGPAKGAGVLDNDILLSVDGQSLEGVKVDVAVKFIRGKKGTRLTLRLQRDGGRILDLSIVRAEVKSKNVEWKVVQDLGRKVGLITLRDFRDANACAKIRGAILELEREKKVEGLILDLRGNGGGLLDQAVCIGGLFFGKKVVVSVKDLKANGSKDYWATDDAITNLPLVTLIDAGSASASEIVSGAIQDHQRGWILGDRSFGKGSVQSAEPEFWGLEILSWHTIQRFYQPNGRTNQIVGILPDFFVPRRPSLSEDERFALREQELYPNALEAVSKPWVQPRPEEVTKIESCRQADDRAEARYRSVKNSDFQALMAQEVLSCER
jgi:carboxyl-terminal processing protease